MIGLLGKKIGQTRVYNAKGHLTAVTVVLAGPNRVLQCKTVETDGYSAVQLGFEEQKEHRVTRPLLGHVKKFKGTPVKRIREFRDFSLEVKPGDTVGPNIFAPGDFVDAIGIKTPGSIAQRTLKSLNGVRSPILMFRCDPNELGHEGMAPITRKAVGEGGWGRFYSLCICALARRSKFAIFLSFCARCLNRRTAAAALT